MGIIRLYIFNKGIELIFVNHLEQCLAQSQCYLSGCYVYDFLLSQNAPSHINNINGGELKNLTGYQNIRVSTPIQLNYLILLKAPSFLPREEEATGK